MKTCVLEYTIEFRDFFRLSSLQHGIAHQWEDLDTQD